MDWLAILERYGIPLVVACAFWLFIQKQNKFIQDELQKELREPFPRVESIIVMLIDQLKKMQLEQQKMEADIQLQKQKQDAELQLKREELQMKMEIRKEELRYEAQLRGFEQQVGGKPSTNLPRVE